MNFEEVQFVIDNIFFAKTKRHLKTIEIFILKGAFEGKNYTEIARDYCCTPEYISHDVAPKLWKLISQATGEKLNKRNFRHMIESNMVKCQALRKNSIPSELLQPEVISEQEVSLCDIFKLLQQVVLRVSELERKFVPTQNNLVQLVDDSPSVVPAKVNIALVK
jgi:hypothetical protein